MVKNVAYVVFKGRKTGIFKTWYVSHVHAAFVSEFAYTCSRMETETQVIHYPHNKQKGYTSLADAEHAWNEYRAIIQRGSAHLTSTLQPDQIPNDRNLRPKVEAHLSKNNGGRSLAASSRTGSTSSDAEGNISSRIKKEPDDSQNFSNLPSPTDSRRTFIASDRAKQMVKVEEVARPVLLHRLLPHYGSRDDANLCNSEHVVLKDEHDIKEEPIDEHILSNEQMIPNIGLKRCTPQGFEESEAKNPRTNYKLDVPKQDQALNADRTESPSVRESDAPYIKISHNLHELEDHPKAYPASSVKPTYSTCWVDYVSVAQKLWAHFDRITSQWEPPLHQEQLDLIQTILKGRNVFYTGSAGCGKSTVLHVLVEILMCSGIHVYVVAPTGSSAYNVGGVTYMRYAAWSPNLMRRSMEELEAKCHERKVWKRLNHTEILIIDEISMIENHKLARLNNIMKEARNCDKAFGGVQVVVTGDFCQLPPVCPFKFCYLCGQAFTVFTGPRYFCQMHGEVLYKDRWAFKSEAWDECNFVNVNLQIIHRQSDTEFIRILERFRFGMSISLENQHLLLNHESETSGGSRLFPTNQRARNLNEKEFALLQTPVKSYTCRDHFRHNKEHFRLAEKSERDPEDNSLICLQDHRYQTKLDLREGTVVMLLVNLDVQAGLVNGAQGVVTGFAECPNPKDCRRTSAEHREYKVARLAEFSARTSIKEYPVVTFTNGVKQTIYGNCEVEELGDSEPYSLISRTQIPLIHAWAITIHKCQGLTLSRVIVNLDDAWESGQDYVALSRANVTTLAVPSQVYSLLEEA